MALHNIQLATVVLHQDMSAHGAKQVISGPPGEARGKGTCIAACMERLHDGIKLSLPFPDDSGSVRWEAEPTVLVRAWMVCLSADYPAAAACCGFKMSTSARSFCRQCMLDQTDKSKYPKPCSFLSNPPPFELRSMESHQKQHQTYKQLESTSGMHTYLMETGVADFESPMNRVPLFDVTCMAPQDIMHVLAEGVLKTEIAAMLFTLIRKRKWGLTLKAVNKACRAYKWPTGHHAPNFRDVILDGVGKGATAAPKRGCHVHGTAGAVLDFTLHSLVILRPLIKDLQDPVFRSWKMMVSITMLCMQQTFTVAHAHSLAALIEQHQRLFLSIPEYAQLFKPKHHFCAHIPLDILRFGPPRQYWCMRFEALNQVLKHIARGGNYKDTCKRCAEFFSMRSTLSTRYGLHEHWGDSQSLSHDVVETVRELPIDDGSEHASTVRYLMQHHLHGITTDGDGRPMMQIRWVKKLFHSGCSFTANEAWVYFKTWESAACATKPMTLALLHKVAQISDLFYVILHVFPHCIVENEADDGMPLIKLVSAQPQVAIFPLHMLTLVSMWRVPEPEMQDTYRFVPRIFG